MHSGRARGLPLPTLGRMGTHTRPDPGFTLRCLSTELFKGVPYYRGQPTVFGWVQSASFYILACHLSKCSGHQHNRPSSLVKPNSAISGPDRGGRSRNPGTARHVRRHHRSRRVSAPARHGAQHAVVPENAKQATRRDPKRLPKAGHMRQIGGRIDWDADYDLSGITRKINELSDCWYSGTTGIYVSHPWRVVCLISCSGQPAPR